MSAQQLQAVFQELDYLDDGYEDGLVSHVGLRRIILETPELEADLGPTFTRALLARAEQNIYGRLTFEEFLLLAREVAVYTHGYRQQQQQHQHPNSANHNPYVAKEWRRKIQYIMQQSDLLSRNQRGKIASTTSTSTAANLHLSSFLPSAWLNLEFLCGMSLN